MATAADPSPNDPQMVGNAFVEQYYTMLHQSPEMVHKFYLDSSVVSRPAPDGTMTSVTTLKDINDIILSLEYQKYTDEIYSADSQGSYMNSVIVLVTGCLTGKDSSKKRQFTQSFFLAPQGNINGYYVLNDIFRYVDIIESTGIEINDDEITPTASITPSFVSEPCLVPDEVVDSGNIALTQDQAAPLEKEFIKEREVSPLLENGTVDVVDIPVISSPKAAAHENADLPVAVPTPTQTQTPTLEALPSHTDIVKIQSDATKKSYASIVSEMKGKPTPFAVRAQPPRSVERPRAVEKPQVPIAAPRQASPPSGENVSETAKGYSIFVANLPMDATVEQLNEIFSKFGVIKPDGVRVRSSNRGVQGKVNCYGFVEFENASSVKSAIEVSPIMIGNRKAAIEEKRGSSDAGRYERRASFNRNDSFKNNGNFNGGRNNYGRNGFDKRGDGQPRQNGEGANGKVYQNGGGRGPRQGQSQGPEQSGAKKVAST
ncbi:hypothetical protein ACFE04_005572 [Oxalis oulophora]